MVPPELLPEEPLLPDEPPLLPPELPPDDPLLPELPPEEPPELLPEELPLPLPEPASPFTDPVPSVPLHAATSSAAAARLP